MRQTACSKDWGFVAELYYTVSENLHRFARIENGQVVEMDFEIQGKSSSKLGGIYKGKVIEIQKPLRAAFIDIGDEKPGMLPLSEGNLPQLTHGESVLVQVTRTENPIEDKGVRLTRMITLSLGPLLYTPFKKGLSLSKRLKERDAYPFNLKDEEGLIVRHWAEPDESLQEMLEQLRKEWDSIKGTGKPGEDLLTRVLRSLGPGETITIDSLSLLAKTKGRGVYLKDGAFDERCETAWESLSDPEVSVPQGGSLYIEETHGLTVVDTNSGGALRHLTPFNHRAVKEAIHQIRLRDLSGKIVIDLIDSPKHAEPLIKGLHLPSDLEIWGLSNMGLLEMIRRRKRLSLPRRLKYQLN